MGLRARERPRLKEYKMHQNAHCKTTFRLQCHAIQCSPSKVTITQILYHTVCKHMKITVRWGCLGWGRWNQTVLKTHDGADSIELCNHKHPKDTNGTPRHATTIASGHVGPASSFHPMKKSRSLPFPWCRLWRRVILLRWSLTCDDSLVWKTSL